MEDLLQTSEKLIKDRILNILFNFNLYDTSVTGAGRDRLKEEILETINYIYRFYDTYDDFIRDCIALEYQREFSGIHYFSLRISRKSETLNFKVELSGIVGQEPRISIYNYTAYTTPVEL